MIAAVFLPAIFIGLRAGRLLFSIADGFERVRAHTILDQGLLCGICAAFAQRQVVFGGTAVVAVALNLHLPAFLLDELCGLGQRLLRIRTKISLVVIEVNVFDRLGKELVVRDGRWRGRRSRRWGWGGRYGNLRCSLLRSSRAFRGQMIRCGLSGRYRL